MLKKWIQPGKTGTGVKVCREQQVGGKCCGDGFSGAGRGADDGQAARRVTARTCIAPA